MIVDKNKTRSVEQEQPKQSSAVSAVSSISTIEEAVDTNAMSEAYKSVRQILAAIPKDPNDENSEPLFKTIKLDNGQLSRIKRNKLNEEYGIAFPAVFIHFIDVYYNQGTSKISEGRGTMRIHYVLNRLNNSDDGEEGELEGFEVFKRIVAAIEAKKASFTPLVSRFQLQYWDQPLSFDDGLQPYWIDYQIWFNDYTAYRYKDYVDVHVVEPPYTNFSDQNETANPNGIPDDKSIRYDDTSWIEFPDSLPTTFPSQLY